MNNRLDTRYPVLPAILERWSPRSFAGRQPEAHKLQSMFEAARLAPSAHNTQPSRFLLGRKGGMAYEKLFTCLDPHNREWAHCVPVLVLASVMRRRFSQVKADFVPYPHCMHDLGLSVMSFMLQGQHLGLHCHPMAAFDPEKAQRDFDIPPLFAPGIIIAVGYLGDPGALPPDLRVRETGPRTRRPLEEIVFEEAWGQSSSLFAGQD
ncbi:nitroreductase family protein [Emcibacter sp. SYSU 3D8]|uniref:nitroreductase family protein n=1 Tax=Emcibacter sp. SYSU 3D8 TaxID=3133969 RepID=UPI0031FEAB85